MGIKQSIVVKNRYTQKKSDGKGSRGSSPGAYITGYMARTDAVENVNAYIQTYMMREDAVITIDEVNPKDGVAFNSDSLTMDYASVERTSQKIQGAFDANGTVLETILSFDHDYLVANKIVPDDLVVEKKGDYRGHVDHLRLRAAIAHGMDRLEASGRFDELTYVAVIQVDTQHVHCHIALADTGENPVVGKDGRPKGKLTAHDMDVLRRGIDSHLDVQKSLVRYANNAQQTRQTLVDYTQTQVAQSLDEKTLPRAIIQSLPENRKLWRAGSKATSMKGAQALVRAYVQDSLDQEDSPFAQAYQALEDYADYRTEREGLDESERQKIIDKGLTRIYVSCENVIFNHLKTLSDEELTSYGQALTVNLDDSTPDDAEAGVSVQGDDNDRSLLEDSLDTVRSYKRRYNKARDIRDTAREVMDQIDEQEEAGDVHPEARYLYLHMQNEARYAQGLMTKYNHLDPLAHHYAQVRSDFISLARQEESINQRTLMLKDDDLARASSDEEAEDLGLERYGHFGGHLMRSDEGRNTFQLRLERGRRAFMRDKAIITAEWEDREIAVTSSEITFTPGQNLKDVAGYDLHDEAQEIRQPMTISARIKTMYERMVSARTRYLQAAKDYLLKTNQDNQLFVLNEDDIRVAQDYKEELETIEPEDDGTYVIVPWAAPWANKVRVDEVSQPMDRTVAMDHRILDTVREDMDQSVSTISHYLDEAKEEEMDSDIATDPLIPWARSVQYPEPEIETEPEIDDSPEF